MALKITEGEVLVVEAKPYFQHHTYRSLKDMLGAYTYIELSKATESKHTLKAKKDELVDMVIKNFDQAYKDYNLWECDQCGNMFDGDNGGQDYCSETCENKSSVRKEKGLNDVG